MLATEVGDHQRSETSWNAPTDTCSNNTFHVATVKADKRRCHPVNRLWCIACRPTLLFEQKDAKDGKHFRKRERLREKGFLKGKIVAVDATTLEANAAITRNLGLVLP